MRILHLCNDFSLSKVHSNLYRSLDSIGLEQVIYHSIKKNTPVGNNKFEFKVETSELIFSKTLQTYHRIFYKNKIEYLFRDLLTKTTLDQVTMVHATTLFSDGGIAYKIKKKFGIPYIVAVRSTDIKVFLKYRQDLVHLCINILKEADKIVFISKSLKKAFFENPYLKKHKSILESKCEIIYNGIDVDWLEDPFAKKSLSPYKILYVGKLIKRKNVLNVARAVIELNKKEIRCELNIVGDGGADEAKAKALAILHKNIINYIGPIRNKSILKEIYRDNHIFAMPSSGETFGLVYLEALSQGLPILYNKNDGIDGVFEAKVGEKCTGSDICDIMEALEKLIANYVSYELDKIDFSLFHWSGIAKVYQGIYRSDEKK